MFIVMAHPENSPPHVFSWPSKALKHIEQLLQSQMCSLWKSPVCTGMWRFSLQRLRTSVNMHLCKYTSRTVPEEHVPNKPRQKGTSVFMVSDSAAQTKRFQSLETLLVFAAVPSALLSPFPICTYTRFLWLLQLSHRQAHDYSLPGQFKSQHTHWNESTGQRRLPPSYLDKAEKEIGEEGVASLCRSKTSRLKR